MSLRLSILEALNTRVMGKSTILDLFDIKGSTFNGAINYLIQSKWVKHSNPQPNTLTAGFLITDLGRDKINSVIQSRKTMQKKYTPDFERMRDHLGIDNSVCNNDLIDLWNKKTDFYVPYQGDNELRVMTSSRPVHP
ncbi:MAG: hypothetical protein ABGX53_03095 [Candidatus Thioglobus sp.]